MTTPANSRPLTPQTVQRLAFIRFLYAQGVEQSRQPKMLAATSVLSFHDAVELFLVLAGEHMQINVPTQIHFPQYWDKLQPGLPANTELPSKKAMDRMNTLRKNLKHDGSIPSEADIEQVRADVTTFFTDATPLVFGGDFAKIDMLDLVSREQTVKLLQYAQSRADAGDLPEAMATLSIAFTELIDHYAQARSTNYNPPFQFGGRVDSYDQHLPSLGGSRQPQAIGQLVRFIEKASNQLKRVTRATQEMQQAMRITALGIDLRRYAQFEVLAPRIVRHLGGQTHFTVQAGHQALTAEDYQFGSLFVIESALQTARADEALNKRLEHHRANNPEPGVWSSHEDRQWNGPSPL